MNKTVVLNVVGLSSALIGEHAPFLKQWISENKLSVIRPNIPAVTTTIQSTYLTGKTPAEHGIVANGWYDRMDCEFKFWKQSNRLVQGEKIWERAKKEDPSFTCANMFWWYNMYSSVDFSVTPRPNYLSDGRKIPDCYSHPADLRDHLQDQLGTFPLFNFWGPNSNIKSSRWIANASKIVEEKYSPTLSLIYLPHLDYCLQKYGRDFSNISKNLKEIDALVEDLVHFFQKRGAKIVLLSEYGITSVTHPIHLNRRFREKGLIALREERGLEILDGGASKAFALADHQIAHIYVNDPSSKSLVRKILEETPGIDLILDEEGKRKYNLDHERAGDFVVVADAESWFSYYYWMDDKKAPDYARLVAIHYKPGFDPVEVFMTSKLRALYKLIRKKLGFRYLMDVIPLDATLVKGSHGRISESVEDLPVLITAKEKKQTLEATEVYQVLWDELTNGEKAGS